MDAGSNVDDTRTILLTSDDEHPSQTFESTAIEERTATAYERLKSQLSKVHTKIYRFPRELQGIGGYGDRYIVPSVVAIGPYHNGSPHLRKMEEVKLAAAYLFCRHSAGHYTSYSSMEVYEKILSVVGDARACYDADDPSVEGLSDADFATMMFLDGCFLLQYMIGGGDEPVLQNRMTLSTGPSIQRDIFLLENQIPWLVLQVLMGFMPVDVRDFVTVMQEKFHPGPEKAKEKDRRPWMCWGSTSTTMPPGRKGRERVVNNADDYTPPHLLGLLWYSQVGSMPPYWKNYRGFVSSLKSSSAAELAEIGVKLGPSTRPWFADMYFRRRHLFSGELSLSPMFLNDLTACWLVNMVALEASTSGASEESDGYVVSSYLSMLAMLMDREEDVQQLRAKTLLYSTFSDKQALGFFKGLAEHLRFGDRYIATLESIYSYRRHWSIFSYRFIYKHYRAIAAVMSAAGVLFSILNALYSLKKPYKT